MLTVYAAGVSGCGLSTSAPSASAASASAQQGRSLLERESGVSPVEAGQNHDRWSSERQTGIVQNQRTLFYAYLLTSQCSAHLRSLFLISWLHDPRAVTTHTVMIVCGLLHHDSRSEPRRGFNSSASHRQQRNRHC